MFLFNAPHYTCTLTVVCKHMVCNMAYPRLFAELSNSADAHGHAHTHRGTHPYTGTHTYKHAHVHTLQQSLLTCSNREMVRQCKPDLRVPLRKEPWFPKYPRKLDLWFNQ